MLPGVLFIFAAVSFLFTRFGRRRPAAVFGVAELTSALLILVLEETLTPSAAVLFASTGILYAVVAFQVSARSPGASEERALPGA